MAHMSDMCRDWSVLGQSTVVEPTVVGKHTAFWFCQDLISFVYYFNVIWQKSMESYCRVLTHEWSSIFFFSPGISHHVGSPIYDCWSSFSTSPCPYPSRSKPSTFQISLAVGTRVRLSILFSVDLLLFSWPVLNTFLSVLCLSDALLITEGCSEVFNHIMTSNHEPFRPTCSQCSHIIIYDRLCVRKANNFLRGANYVHDTGRV